VATERVISAAVDRAVSTARVDASAPVEPRDERCSFDPAALEAVVQLCSSGHQRDAVIAAVDGRLQRAVEELDRTGALAAMMLIARIEAATDQRQIPVENIQGDVGSGHGPPAP
jgi:hypothetical protein